MQSKASRHALDLNHFIALTTLALGSELRAPSHVVTSGGNVAGMMGAFLVGNLLPKLF